MRQKVRRLRWSSKKIGPVEKKEAEGYLGAPWIERDKQQTVGYGWELRDKVNNSTGPEVPR